MITEKDFGWKAEMKLIKEKIMNQKIKEIMNVQYNITGIIEERGSKWF